MEPIFDVTQIVDRQPVNRFLLGVLFLCALVTLADGYNISVVAFAGPAILKAWHLKRAALGPLISSSLIAGLVGPFLFGAIGDRIGRHYAMLASVLLIGVFGILSAYCTNVGQMLIVRFIAGIGMSGALAVTVAAVNEFAPRRVRATFVTIVFSGTTIGSGLPGLVAPGLLAAQGWPSLFLVGGVIPLALAVVIFLFLPETPKFLCVYGKRTGELGTLLRRLDPQLQAPADAHYVLSGESVSARLPWWRWRDMQRWTWRRW
jgi:MFS transporter, AAHS family, 4-hydroxybenzoate transporter